MSLCVSSSSGSVTHISLRLCMFRLCHTYGQDLSSVDAEMSSEDWAAPYNEEMEKSHAISKKFEVPYEDE